MSSTTNHQETIIRTQKVTITPFGIYSSGIGRFTHYWEIECMDDVDIMEIEEDYFIVEVAGIGKIFANEIEELIIE